MDAPACGAKPSIQRRYRAASASEQRGRERETSEDFIVPRKQGKRPYATLWRERSETNCCTCRCKSCRRNSPFGAVVISGSPQGDLGGWQPGRRSLRQAEHPLGLISPGGEQPGGP